MRRTLLAMTAAALALLGCASPQERQQMRMVNAESTCSAAGFKQGTPEYSQCAITVYQQDQARRDALVRAGIQMMQPQPAPPAPPAPVVCVPVMRNGSYYCQ
jgi:hypothetical protein